jgi:hypothetical protein
MDMELGLSHWKKNIDRECLKTALRRMFGLDEEGETAGWRKPHNEKLHN